MTTDDIESATYLAKRIERDGEWHVSESWQSVIRDKHDHIVAVADGSLFEGRDFERDAADIVEARRLVPVLLADVKRLEAQLRDARAYGAELWERLQRTYPEAAQTGERHQEASRG